MAEADANVMPCMLVKRTGDGGKQHPANAMGKFQLCGWSLSNFGINVVAAVEALLRIIYGGKEKECN